MVSSADFLMYLAAIKSLYRQIGRGKVHIIDDGSLTRDQRQLLRQHIDGANIIHIDDAPCRNVPKGGTWERLLIMVSVNREDYVIQLDADTLTTGTIPEIDDAFGKGYPFILGGDATARVATMREISERARHQTSGHIQILVESQLYRIPGLLPNYVRGSSAFFGLPAGSVSFEDVERFSDAMYAEIGERWNEWGSEQITVNYLLANLPGTKVLQPPAYAHNWTTPPGSDSRFIHFIGTHRFRRQFYAWQTRKTIAELNKTA
jgi:hypothetical protein